MRPTDFTAEFLIGVQESSGEDPVNRLAVFQRQLLLVNEEGERLSKFEKKLDTIRSNPEEIFSEVLVNRCFARSTC